MYFKYLRRPSSTVDLEEEIYMEQPKGFVAADQEHLVYRLRKSLYGLKQAPRQWYRKFNDFILFVEFRKSDEDHCLFSSYTSSSSYRWMICFSLAGMPESLAILLRNWS